MIKRILSAPVKMASLRSFSSTGFGPKDFYKVTHNANVDHAPGSGIKGIVMDHAIDLHTVRPGRVIDIPYEVTLHPSIRDFW